MGMKLSIPMSNTCTQIIEISIPIPTIPMVIVVKCLYMFKIMLIGVEDIAS